MKKALILTIGITLVLGVLLVWLYLMMFGSPKTADEVFSNFGLGGDTGIVNVEEEAEVDVSPTDTSGSKQALRQLTTRPVAGAYISSTTVRYVERGTGHVYEINLQSGSETLISATTLPKMTNARFSSSGNKIILESEFETTIASIMKDDTGEGILDGINLPLGSKEVSFNSETDSVYYLAETPAGSSGYTYDLKTGTSKEIFSIPLRDIHVLWGENTYIYTTPSATHIGYVYKIVGNKIQYVSGGKLGLTALGTNTDLILSYSTEENIRTENYSDTSAIEMSIPMFPEKCTGYTLDSSMMICAAPLTLPAGSFPDDWYKGIISLPDALWRVDLFTGIAELLSIFLEETGREIDVSAIGTNDTGTLIWFINKNDDTLWMFDTTI